MPRRSWTSIDLPDALANDAREFLQDHPELGPTLGAFARHAIGMVMAAVRRRDGVSVLDTVRDLADSARSSPEPIDKRGEVDR